MSGRTDQRAYRCVYFALLGAIILLVFFVLWSAFFGGAAAAAGDSTGKPALTLVLGNVHWASYADYTQNKLSLDYTISNTGANIAHNVNLTQVHTTNGVVVLTTIPYPLGDIAPGMSTAFVLEQGIPPGVRNYALWLQGTAEDMAGTTYDYGTAVPCYSCYPD